MLVDITPRRTANTLEVWELVKDRATLLGACQAP